MLFFVGAIFETSSDKPERSPLVSPGIPEKYVYMSYYSLNSLKGSYVRACIRSLDYSSHRGKFGVLGRIRDLGLRV